MNKGVFLISLNDGRGHRGLCLFIGYGKPYSLDADFEVATYRKIGNRESFMKRTDEGRITYQDNRSKSQCLPMLERLWTYFSGRGLGGYIAWGPNEQGSGSSKPQRSDPETHLQADFHPRLVLRDRNGHRETRLEHVGAPSSHYAAVCNEMRTTAFQGRHASRSL